MTMPFILPVMIRKRFSLLQTIEDIHFGLVRMYVNLLDNIYMIIFGNNVYRQIVGIPMGKNCAGPVANLFFFALKEIS